MSEALRAWLSEELERRKWSQGDLSRQAGLSRPFISRVISGDLSPSVNFCHKIAAALGEAPEKVLRLAGILPTSMGGDDSIVQEITEIARSLPPEDQQEILDFARFRKSHQKKP